MARKTRLTRAQGKLLWLLEEAGEEDLLTIVVTLKPPDRDAFDRDIDGLVRLGFVYRSQERGEPSVVLTAAGRKALTT